MSVTGNAINAAAPAIAGLSRRNLLDNWYFANPVNQRGAAPHVITENATAYRDVELTNPSSVTASAGTEATYVQDGVYSILLNGYTRYVSAADVACYSGAGYTIDRWQIIGADDASITVSEGYITLRAGTQTSIFRQKFENYMWMYDTALHLSVLTDKGLFEASGTPAMSSDAYQSPLIKLDDKWFCNVTGTASKTDLYVRFWCSTPASSINIYAIKLELGDTQTLAHQENGVWVLNEIPDFGEELRKCQRYFCKSFPFSLAPISANANIDYATMGTARNNGPYSVSFPVEMRTVPTITKIGTAFCFAETNDGTESTTYDSSIVPAGITSHGFEIFNSFYNGFATFGMCWTASADL